MRLIGSRFDILSEISFKSFTLVSYRSFENALCFILFDPASSYQETLGVFVTSFQLTSSLGCTEEPSESGVEPAIKTVLLVHSRSVSTPFDNIRKLE